MNNTINLFYNLVIVNQGYSHTKFNHLQLFHEFIQRKS